MKKFSERIGAVSRPSVIQTNSISEDLRNSLWNLFYSFYEHENDYWRMVAPYVAKYFRKVPMDDVPYYDSDCRRWVRQYFFPLVGIRHMIFWSSS